MIPRVVRSFRSSKVPRHLFSAILLLLLNGFFPAIALSQTADIYSTGAYFYHNGYRASTTMDAHLPVGATSPTGWLRFNYRTGTITVYMASTRINSISLSGQTATVQGDCTVNGAAGYSFTATVTDRASPGTGADAFGIDITGPGGYSFSASGTLAGGDLLATGDTTAPAVAITSPQNLITVGSSPITVSGTIDDPTATVTVNGIPATLTDGQFTVPGVAITEGMNTIVARAIDPANNVATASINISLDSTPPHIAITSPPDGYRTTASSVTVTGIINDIVRGTVNETQGRVLVNGIEAQVSNRNFIVESVPLNVGANTITAVGSDQWGNTASTSITVQLDITPRPTIQMVSGNNQSGPIGSSLPSPLVVSLTDDTGAPMGGATVIFRVIENNGTLRGLSEERAVAVTTDANGQAQATLTLGTWAGSGNNRVEATASGVEGSVFFTASGTQKPPAAIYVAQGSQQRGASSQLLPEPLVAFVTDEGHNPLGSVPVTFKAMEGGGHFANGLDTLVVNTDSDGRATVAFTLGPAAGNDSNIVGATFEGNTGPQASFRATGLTPGDPGNTRISGIVLDNSNNPIPDVTLRVEGTTRETRTGANGQFTLDNVPVGPVHLIADGSTAGTLGVIEYPTLMYELTTIAGANNSLSMPIYLLPLDLRNARRVGGNQDVTYTIPNVPGFSLTIKANSVTFPDGRKEGYISVTQVHADKVPMVPQIGQQPRFIITIQPAGAVFDPPAPITLPNVDGLAPGEKTNMYSFDHDLGIFVSIGTGTVSEDGSVIVSDPGVGVVKAGWHCGGSPVRTGSTNNCPVCAPCNSNTQLCTPLPVGAGCPDDGNVCTEDKCGVCTVGNCPGGGCTHPAKPDGTTVVGQECKECRSGNAANKPDNIVCTDDGNACTEDKCQGGTCIHPEKFSQTVPASVGPPLNYLPLVAAGVPAGWGVTTEDDPVIDITAYCDAAGVWKAKVTQADQQGRQSVRLLPGVVEVTAALVASTNSCATLATMKASLNSVANQGSDSGYYMLAAVRAHEDLHVTQYRASIAPAYVALKTALEALTVPLNAHATATAAKAAIKALPAYTTANATFHALDVAANNATAAHNPMQPFIDAEHGVVDPMVATIDARRGVLMCP